MAAPGEQQHRLAYEPAFDGLRGLAVAAILVFHAGFGWAGGGFLGVSTFFTLSGFLITSLLVAERDASGTVSLRSFYARRVRRLWPASALALLLVVAYARFFAAGYETVGFRRDLLAALSQLSNWWFIHDGRSYGALFRTPSLVQHYWSLAIEEQFYLVVPPALVVALRRGWTLGRMAVATALAIGASALVTVAIGTAHGTDRIYYGTDTRAVELLVGVLLALVVARRPALPAEARQMVNLVGLLALAVTIGAWAVVGATDGGLYRGGLWGYAVLSGAIVLACREAGPVRTLLSWRPLRELGAISYGVYLLHWPIYRWITPERFGHGLTATFGLRLAVTLGAAVASARLLEQPIRRGALGRSGRSWLPPVALGASAVLVLALAVVVAPSGDGFDIDRAAEQYADAAAHVRAPLPGAPRVGVFGDSTALALSVGLPPWADATGKIGLGRPGVQVGCGIIQTGRIRYGGAPGPIGSDCLKRDDLYRRAVGHFDVAVVLFGAWDVGDHRLPGDTRWRTMGDPTYERALLRSANHIVDLLTAKGAVVVWLLPPEIRLGSVGGRAPAEPLPQSDPARMHRFVALIRALARSRPDDVRTVDLAGWLRRRPGGELAPDLRPDGVHLTPSAAKLVVREFLGDAILRAARAR